MARPEGYQFHLGESSENLESLVRFPREVMIYPERAGRGVLQEDLFAEKANTKIKGLTGYRARSQAQLYFDGHTRTLQEGDLFGAYSHQAKKVAKKGQR